MKNLHSFTNDALGKDDATALAERIRKKEVSPLEVTQAAIARANSVGEQLNAIEIKAFDEAVKTAESGKVVSGPFTGVPTFIKDNADLEGFPTRNGSRAFTPHTAKEHGKYTAQYLEQGFIYLGKSQMPEFGFNASTEFEDDHPVLNPWHTEYSAGGSSGGSAALVAAGVVPIAHANDGGGSIRIPASCCGLVGLKPTRDRHRNNKSAEMMPLNIISEGVVTRSVRDTAAFHYGMECSWANPKLKPIGFVEGPSARKLKIGLVFDSITGYKTCDETRESVQHTAQILEKLGHFVEPVELKIPQSFISDFMLYWSMLAFSMGIFGKFILGSDFQYERLDPFSKGLVEHYKRHLLDTPAALFRLFQSQGLYSKMMQHYDAVLTPVLGHSVPKLGHLKPEQSYEELIAKLDKYVMFTPLNNASGSPAISLPLGSCANGLPIGMQFMAAHGDEATLLDIAYQLEAEMGFREIF